MEMKDIIRKLRTEKGLTLEELGKVAGVQKAAVSKWEKGETKNLKRSTIKKLSDYFNVTPSYLMGMREKEDLCSVGESAGKYKADSVERLPLIGTIAAGTPILAEQNIEDYFNIDTRVKADFALRIKGDSMIGAGISSGDIVFIKQQCTLENGEIGAILMGNSATLKKFYKDENTIILQAENDTFKPIVLTSGNVKILGKLVAALNIRE